MLPKGNIDLGGCSHRGRIILQIIFSRKGFDTGTGGCASPIIQGACISLPIPTRMPTPMTFSDLNGAHGDLVEDLTTGRITRTTPCHLDPDIDATLVARQPDWRGALGQVGAAQGHLDGSGVGAGALFLFWGLFRPVTRKQRWIFDGPPEHRVFGWLQAGEVIHLGSDGSHALRRYPWLADHPHVRAGWSEKNTLYIASEELRLNGRSTGLPGWGRLPFGYRLTAANGEAQVRAGRWRAPDWLNPKRGGSGMTYHRAPERWDDETVQVVSRGQEFVANTNGSDEARAWIETVLTAGTAADA